jgi:2'-5' RNA ligase
MSLAVISYPKLSQTDVGWLAKIRTIYPKLHYPKFAPHFTFVFPSERISADILIGHVQAQTATQPRIRFTIRCALPMPDALSDNTHLFLVPDEGFSAILRLHDRLYTGLLADDLRLDIPYIPHITLGYTPDPAFCKQVADDLNRQPFTISGAIEQLSIVRVEGETATTIASIPLI